MSNQVGKVSTVRAIGGVCLTIGLFLLPAIANKHALTICDCEDFLRAVDIASQSAR